MHIQSRIVYEAVVGSKAWGLADEKSDTDRKGIWIGPPCMNQTNEVQVQKDELGDRKLVEFRHVIRKLIDGDLNMIELAFTKPLTKSDAFPLFDNPRQFLTERWRKKLIGFCYSVLHEDNPPAKHVVDVVRRTTTALHFFHTGEYVNDLTQFCRAEDVAHMKQARRELGTPWYYVNQIQEHARLLDRAGVDEGYSFNLVDLQRTAGEILAWHWKQLDFYHPVTVDS